jgi:hypothetical protein
MLSGNASLQQNEAALIQSSGTPTINVPFIGTLLLEAQSTTTITNQTIIQTLMGGEANTLVLENADLMVETSAYLNLTDIRMVNSTIQPTTYTTVKNITLENSHWLWTSQMKTNTLSLDASSTIYAKAPWQITSLGTEETDWSYQGLTVIENISTAPGSTLEQNSIDWAKSTASLALEGNLLLNGPEPLWIEAGKLSSTQSATITLTLENRTYLSLSGTGQATIEGNLDLLFTQLTIPEETFIIIQADREDAYLANFSNLSPEGTLTTNEGTFQISTTWDGTHLTTYANNFQPIPEPTTWTLTLLTIGGALLSLRRKNPLTKNTH